MIRECLMRSTYIYLRPGLLASLQLSVGRQDYRGEVQLKWFIELLKLSLENYANFVKSFR